MLDVGGGWGSFTEQAGQRGIHVTSLTISRESEVFQTDLIDRRYLSCGARAENLEAALEDIIARCGDTPALYRSVRATLLSLPEETLVYPVHDSAGRQVSSIGQAKARSPRLGGDRSLAAFVAIMSELDLGYPTFIANAVPGNRECGTCPVGLPEDPQRYCKPVSGSR